MINISRARYWLMPLPLFGLLGLSYWLNQQVTMEPATPDSSKRHDPDAIVENFSATRLSDGGTPHFIMAAKRMQHFPDDDSTTLDGPRITSLSLDRAPIHAKSTIGIVSSKGDEIFLQGNVEVLREADAQQSTLTLQTEFLRVIPDKDLMDTDRTVTIVDARDALQATGMQMNNRARTIRLLSHVKGEYAPPR